MGAPFADGVGAVAGVVWLDGDELPHAATTSPARHACTTAARRVDLLDIRVPSFSVPPMAAHGSRRGTAAPSGAIATLPRCAPSPSSTRAMTVAEHPDPRPGTGEALIAVRAAGINGADLMQVQGFYPAPPGSPQDIPGMEFAGEVIELGPGAMRFAVGDRVMAVVGGGAQAELHHRARAAADAGSRRGGLGGGRRLSRGLHHRARRTLHPGPAACGRTRAHPRRRGRCRGGGGAARAPRRRAGVRDGSLRAAAARGGRARRRRRHRP